VRGEKIRPKHPSRDWQAGAASRERGFPVEDNPFAAHTSSFYRWREGWEYEDQQQAKKAARR
jgi:hypothetical protein